MKKILFYLLIGAFLISCQEDESSFKREEFNISIDSGPTMALQYDFSEVSDFTLEDHIALPNGGFILAGSFWSAEFNEDLGLVFIDSLFQLTGVTRDQNPGKDQFRDITILDNDSYLVTGYQYDQKENRDIIVQKRNGDILVWQSVLRFGQSVVDESYNITPLSNGHIVVSGFTKAGMDADVFVLDAKGNTVKRQKWGGKHKDYMIACVETQSKNLIHGAIYNGYHDDTGDDFTAKNADIVLIGTDTNLTTKWEMKMDGGGHDLLSKMEPVPGGTLLLGSRQQGDTTYFDSYLVKLNIDGEVIWENHFGGKSWNYGEDLFVFNDSIYTLTTQGGIRSSINVDLWSLQGKHLQSVSLSSDEFNLEGVSITGNRDRIILGLIIIGDATKKSMIISLSNSALQN